MAKLTLDSLGEIFEPATASMSWLAACASAIGREAAAPVQWTTPLGLPVMQPYFAPARASVRTLFGAVSFDADADAEAPTPLVRRQRSAFAPNYVHSLDSSHMLLTAKACADAGLTFAAVHDSFWTHAADVPAMSAILREQFVALHSPPLMEDLEAQLHARHPDVRWRDRAGLRLPERGELDLERVRDSTYFFA